MSSIHAVIGNGTAPASVIKEGLRDILEDGDIVAIPWYGKPTDGLAAVYDYILDNNIDFVMLHHKSNEPAKAFTSAQNGSTIVMDNVNASLLTTVGQGGKVLFLWDDRDSAADDMLKLVNFVFDNIGEQTLVLELTNGLAPISLSLAEEAPAATTDDVEVDPTDDSPTSFTREELSIMPIQSLKRMAEDNGLPEGVVGKNNYIDTILGVPLKDSAYPPLKAVTEFLEARVEVVKGILAKSEPVTILVPKDHKASLIMGLPELKASIDNTAIEPMDGTTVNLLKTRALEFGTSILEHVPQGRNRSLAITALEDALGRAIKGVMTDA